MYDGSGLWLRAALRSAKISGACLMSLLFEVDNPLSFHIGRCACTTMKAYLESVELFASFFLDTVPVLGSEQLTLPFEQMCQGVGWWPRLPFVPWLWHIQLLSVHCS